MNVLVNGQSKEFPAPLTLAQLLEMIGSKWGQSPLSHVAVALNDTVVPRQRFTETLLRNGDRIEIVRAVGGG